MRLIIKNGLVFDPINGISGEKKDIFIDGRKIVDDFGDSSAKIIDASNLVVMPGGVDIHSHIAGSKVNLGRMLRPEDSLYYFEQATNELRSGTGFSIPSTFITGYLYAKMGYGFVMEPALCPLKARHTHEEFNDIPIIDKAALPLFDGNWILYNYILDEDQTKIDEFTLWLIQATKGYGIKLVNPGGTECWGWGKNVSGLYEKVPYFNISPAEIITALLKARCNLGLPHRVHLHCNNLGRPGNVKTTLETIKLAGNHELHLTHVQFHSYGGHSWQSLRSGAEEIADAVNKMKNISIDTGNVTLDETTTMTADGPFEFYLQRLTGLKWINSDVELETHPGITPIVYSKNSFVNMIQWAIGLELALLIKDPYQLCLTTDHPNGGPFIRYPNVIAWLMNKKYRDSFIPDKIRSRIVLQELDREYSLEEITIITRCSTARILGLNNKGHLGIGADADVAIYNLGGMSPKEIINGFKRAEYFIKDGKLVVRRGTVLSKQLGSTLVIEGKLGESDIFSEVKEKVQKFYSINMDNYSVEDVYIQQKQAIPLCKSI